MSNEVASTAPVQEVKVEQAPKLQSLTLQEKIKQAAETPEFKKLDEAQEVVQTEPEPKVAEQKVEDKQTGESKEDEPTEFVDVGGKKVKVIDLLDKTTFEVAVGDGKGGFTYHPIEGLQKLLDQAAMGINSARKNEVANKAVKEANTIIKQMQGEVNQQIKAGVEKQLNDLITQIERGIDPSTGKPYGSEEARLGAKEYADKLVSANKTGSSQSLEDLKAELKAEMKKELEARDEKDLQKNRLQNESYAQAMLEKALTPFTQDNLFTLADGKTTNRSLFSRFADEVNSTAVKISAKMKDGLGRGLTLAEGEKAISQATQEVYGDFKQMMEKTTGEKIKSKVQTNKPVAPLKSSGNTPLAKPAAQSPAKNFRDGIARRMALAKTGMPK